MGLFDVVFDLSSLFNRYPSYQRPIYGGNSGFGQFYPGSGGSGYGGYGGYGGQGGVGNYPGSGLGTNILGEMHWIQFWALQFWTLKFWALQFCVDGKYFWCIGWIVALGGGYGGSSFGNSFGSGGFGGSNAYGGYGGYGGFGGKKTSNNDIASNFEPFRVRVKSHIQPGNGGLSSYNGYSNNNYGGQRNLGFGYYRGTDSYGFLPSRETNYYSGTGYRGYSWFPFPIKFVHICVNKTEPKTTTPIFIFDAKLVCWAVKQAVHSQGMLDNRSHEYFSYQS